MDVPERRINLTFPRGHRDGLGFNIRGGQEYGLGIYVSRYTVRGVYKMYLYWNVSVLNIGHCLFDHFVDSKSDLCLYYLIYLTLH